MSAAAETQPPPPPPLPPAAAVEVDGARPHTRAKPIFDDLASDIIMWRTKLLSVLVLLVATAIWVTLQLYRFNFLTVASWVAMFVVSLLFTWGIINRLLGKEPPQVSSMEISESSAVGMANGIREWVEEGVRWMFRVSSTSSGREWVLFAGTMASTWLLSLMGRRFDLLTILYTGLAVGMTVPVVYVKYEHKFKEYGWRLKMLSHKCYGQIEEKLRMFKNRVAAAKYSSRKHMMVGKPEGKKK